MLGSDDGGGAEDLAGGDQAGQVGQRDPADILGFVRQRRSRADRVIQFEPADLKRTIESRQASEEKTDPRIADLYTAIYKLDPLGKALITLFLEDLTYEQMAEATGITANHVGVMLHRAKKKLSCLMTEAAPP